MAALLKQSDTWGRAMVQVRPADVRVMLEQVTDTAPDGRWLAQFKGLIDEAEPRLSPILEAAFRHHVLGAREVLLSIKHIAQTRASGRRIYEVEQDPGRDHVGRHGGHLAQLLFGDNDLLAETNRLMRDVLDMKLGVAFNPTLNTHGTGIELLLQPHGSHLRLSLLDVGSGISQILPIIVQFAYQTTKLKGKHRGVLWVEQPELHLHTGLQARLLAMLVDEVRQDQMPQVVFETHSELLVAAAQYLVSEGRVNAKDVKIIWVGRDETGRCKVTDLLLGEGGGFGEVWPDGKFREIHDLLGGRIL